MDSNLVMYFSLGYCLYACQSSCEYKEIDHDTLRRMIRIEQSNFQFNAMLMDEYQILGLALIRLN